MMITITVPERVIVAAQNRNISVEDFVDQLIDKGMGIETGRPMVSSAMERIRALHTEVVAPKR
jgi:hypothetical protein